MPDPGRNPLPPSGVDKTRLFFLFVISGWGFLMIVSYADVRSMLQHPIDRGNQRANSRPVLSYQIIIRNMSAVSSLVSGARSKAIGKIKNIIK